MLASIFPQAAEWPEEQKYQPEKDWYKGSTNPICVADSIPCISPLRKKNIKAQKRGKTARKAHPAGRIALSNSVAPTVVGQASIVIRGKILRLVIR
jgi:hypothetical protein